MRNSCIYKISGAKTFRLSSTQIFPRKVVIDGKTKTKGFGSNMQNWEKSLRRMYVPDKGKIFVQTDEAGAEALITAYLCKHGNLRELFNHKIKIHVYVALHLFKNVWVKKMKEESVPISDNFNIDELIATPISKIKNNPDWHNINNIIKASDEWSLQERYYYLAKQTAHSSNYGITPPTFRLNVLEKSGGKIVISKEDSIKFIDTYHELFPEIRQWHEEVKRQVSLYRTLYNLHGHPYQITNYTILESEWKELIAWIPQSTVGMITSIAYSNMQKYIEENKKDWDLLNNCHDSYLLQCPIGEENECTLKSKEFIEQEFISPVDGTKFRMGSETKIGFNWDSYKKQINENGLKDL